MRTNLVLYSSKDRNWKIIDFGLHEVIEAHRHLSRICDIGLGYRPPEKISTDLDMNAGDIWNMGCIMFELTTGERPFENDAETWMYANGKSLDIDGRLLVNPSWFAEDVSRMISNMLNRDPSKRDLASELLNTLYNIQGNLNKVS